MKTICHVILVVLAALLWATASSTRASALLFSQYDNQSTYGPSLVRPADGVHAGVADDFNALMMFAETQSLNLLPGDAAIAPAAGDQTTPAIAQGGNLLLAVWTDNRSNPYPSGFYAWSEYKRRETSTGFASTPLVTSSTRSRSQSRPAVRTRTIRGFAGTAPTGSSCTKVSMLAALAITRRIRSKPCAWRPPARCSTPNRSNFMG